MSRVMIPSSTDSCFSKRFDNLVTFSFGSPGTSYWNEQAWGAIINLERTTLCDEITPQCILMHQKRKPCVCSWPKWEYFGWKWWATAVKQTSVFPEQWGCFKGMQCGWWDGVMDFYAWMIVIHNYTFLPCFWWSFFNKLTWIRSCTSNSESKFD